MTSFFSSPPTAIIRGTKHLPIGVEDHFYIDVEIYNNGEEAHQAKVKITHSEELSFVNVISDGVSSTPTGEKIQSTSSYVGRRDIRSHLRY